MSGDTNINVPVVAENKDALSTIRETVSANWQKHRVAILAGTALVAGGLAIALTGGLAAIPGVLAIGLIASGVFGGVGGLGFAAYYASRPIPTVEDITQEATQADAPVENDEQDVLSRYVPARASDYWLRYDDEKQEPVPNTPAKEPQGHLDRTSLPVLSEGNTLDVAAFCAEAKEHATSWTTPASAFAAPSPKAGSSEGPTGSLVDLLMPEFSPRRASPKAEDVPAQVLDSPKPKAPIATIVDIEEQEESTPKDAGAESLNTVTTVAVYTPSPLRPLEPKQPTVVTNDNAPEGEAPIEDAIPSALSLLPSARSVVKATAYLTGAVAAATTAYVGYHVAQELMNDECPAFDAPRRSLGQHAAQRLIEIGGNVATSVANAMAAGEIADQGECSIFDHTHKTYAEYYTGKLMGAGQLLQQGLSNIASAMNPFPTASEPSLLPFGTDTTNRTIATDSEPGLIDAASALLTQARESALAANLQDCAGNVKDYFTPGMNVTASEVVECCPLTSGIALPQVPLPSPKLALAGGAALLSTGLALRDPGPFVTEEAEEEVQDVAELPQSKLVKKLVTELKNDDIPDDMKLIRDDEEAAKTEEKKEVVPASGLTTARTLKLVGLAFAGTAAIIGAYRWSQMSEEERALVQNQATTFAASIGNGLASLPDAAERSFANWANDTTWGDTAERLTQWVANADPVGALGQLANSTWEAFVPASQAYQPAFNLTTTCPNIQMSPADILNAHQAYMDAEQASINEDVLAAYYELTTCPMNPPVAGAIAPGLGTDFVDHLLSLSGK